MYGDGFTGRSYYLYFNDSHIHLYSGLGSEKEEELARKKAEEILLEKGIKYNLDNEPFIWDGSM